MKFRKDMDKVSLVGLLGAGLIMVVLGFGAWLKNSDMNAFFLGLVGLGAIPISLIKPRKSNDFSIDERVLKAYEKAGHCAFWILLWYSIAFGIGADLFQLNTTSKLLALDLMPVIGLVAWILFAYWFQKKGSV